MMMTNKLEDWLKTEKEEANIHWDYVMGEVKKRNLDANMIALAMKRCNEVDYAIFKSEVEEDGE